MAKNSGKVFKDFKNDIVYFLNMCSKEDAKLFLSEPKDKKIEDFGRFVCLGIAFNMRGVFMSLFAQYENLGDISDILGYLETVNYDVVKKWVEDFLEKADDTILKKCARSIWEEKKKYFAEHKFKLSEFL